MLAEPQQTRPNENFEGGEREREGHDTLSSLWVICDVDPSLPRKKKRQINIPTFSQSSIGKGDNCSNGTFVGMKNAEWVGEGLRSFLLFVLFDGVVLRCIG